MVRGYMLRGEGGTAEIGTAIAFPRFMGLGIVQGAIACVLHMRLGLPGTRPGR